MFNKDKRERLNPVDRVLTAFACQIPDRVPIDYAANPDIDVRLKKYFGLKKNENEALLKILGVDFRELQPQYTGPRLHAEISGMYVDPVTGMKTKWIEHASGGYEEICDFPLRDADEEQIAAWPVPSADDYDYKSVSEACKNYSKYAVWTGGQPDIINNTGRLRTMEQVLIDLVTDEPAGLMLIDKRMNYELEVVYRTLEAAKGGINFLYLGEDLGTQRGPMISMELFRKHIKPRIKKFADLAKSFNIPVMIHSCGSSSWAFDDLIEIGINVVDTLQPEAKDMDPAYLKRKYGDRLGFHGCISTAGPVAYGTVQEIVDNVKETLEVMMPGGGYCMSPTHYLQDNSPTENVVAMYETTHKFGWYD